MKKFKLVHIISSLKIGGAERVLYNLITKLDREQFEHHVIYIHYGPYVDALHTIGIPTYCISGFLFYWDPFLIIRLYKLIKKLRPSGIHTLLWLANIVGRLVARLLKIPCLTAFHNNCDQNGYIRNSIDRVIFRDSDMFIAVSQEVKQSIIRYLPSASLSNIHVIKNGVNSKIIYQRAIQNRLTRITLGLKEDNFVIGSVGRFEAVKNYTFLIDCFACIKKNYNQARLVLIGIGSQEQLLRKRVKFLGITDSVIFIIGQEANKYYPLFDCFVLTSSQEGISISLLEAMSFSLPCIVSSISRTHSVLCSYKNGIVVLAENQEELLQALVKLIKNKQLGKKLGNAALYTVEHDFDEARMISQYEQLFSKKFSNNKKFFDKK